MENGVVLIRGTGADSNPSCLGHLKRVRARVVESVKRRSASICLALSLGSSL